MSTYPQLHLMVAQIANIKVSIWFFNREIILTNTVYWDIFTSLYFLLSHEIKFHESVAIAHVDHSQKYFFLRKIIEI